MTAETDGNPFFVREILRHLVESGAVTQDAGGRWELSGDLAALGLPPSVHDVVDRRVDRLGANMRRILSAAAVIGREFELELLARVTEAPDAELLDTLEAAVGARLVREHNDRVGWWVFAHNLINHTLYDALGRTRQTWLHRAVAAGAGGDVRRRSGSRIGELARHWNAAAAPVEAEKALAYSRRAGERALEGLAPDEAVRLFGLALDLLKRTGDDPAERCEILIGLGEAQRQTCRREFRDTLLTASRIAVQLGDSDRAARAALANSRGFASTFGKSTRSASPSSSERSNSTAAPSRHAGHACSALLAMELQFDPTMSAGAPSRTSALALAREAGDPRTLADVLFDHLYASGGRANIARHRALTSELQSLAEQIGDPALAIWGHFSGAYAAKLDGAPDRAGENLLRALALAEELGQPVLLWMATYLPAGLQMMLGDLDAAERLSLQALPIGTDAGQSDALMIFGAQTDVIRVQQDRVGEIIELVEQSVEANPRIPAWRAALAQHYALVGRREDPGAVLAGAAGERLRGRAL